MLSDDVRRAYYTKEAFAIIKEFANHPSFVMLSFGNELTYSGDDYTVYGDKLVAHLKADDPTRLYAPGSNIAYGGATPSPNADFFTAQQLGDTHFRRLLRRAGRLCQSESSFHHRELRFGHQPAVRIRRPGLRL